MRGSPRAISARAPAAPTATPGKGARLALTAALMARASPGSAGASRPAPSGRSDGATDALLGGQPPKVVRGLALGRSLHPVGITHGFRARRNGSPGAPSAPAMVVLELIGVPAAPPPTRRFTARVNRRAPRFGQCPLVAGGCPGGVGLARELAEPATRTAPEAHRCPASKRGPGPSDHAQGRDAGPSGRAQVRGADLSRCPQVKAQNGEV